MTATTSLSTQHIAAVVSQISALMGQFNETNTGETLKQIREITDALNETQRGQIKDVLGDVAEQARKSACEVLRNASLRQVAIALENTALDLKWVESTLAQAVENKSIPQWVRNILQERLGAVRSSNAKSLPEAASPQKTKTTPPKIESPRDRFSTYLKQMQDGRWIYNQAREEFSRLNGQAQTVADLMEQIEREKERCWEKSRPAASEHLETCGFASTARAIYEDFDGAEEAIQIGLDSRRVAGWVRAMLNHRLHQIRESVREREFAEQHAQVITEVEKMVFLTRQVGDIVNDAANSAVGVQQALLSEAQRVFAEAEGIQFFFPALEAVIAGKSGTDNIVAQLLRENPEVMAKVAEVSEGRKASAFRWAILKHAERVISSLEEVVQKRTPAPTPATKPVKKHKPCLMQQYDDRRDCRFKRNQGRR